MLLLDIHHEGLSIGNLGNVHVSLMQFIHSRWEVLDLVWLDQRLAPNIFSFFSSSLSRDMGSISRSCPTEILSISACIICSSVITTSPSWGTLTVCHNNIGRAASSHVLLAQQAGGSIAPPVLPAGERYSRIFCPLLVGSSSSSLPSLAVLDVVS